MAVVMCDMNKKVEGAFFLYAVTDSKYTRSDLGLFLNQVESSLKGGVTCLQLREKGVSNAIFFKKAGAVKDLCKKYRVPLIINDNVEIAKAVDADGTHIGQDDMPLTDAVKILGKDKIFGVSATNLREALIAQKEGASYLGVGSIFKTVTKKDAKEVDVATLREICSNVRIPVVAIGGINQSNITELKNTGIAGVAIISAIFSEKNIEATVRRFKKLLNEVI